MRPDSITSSLVPRGKLAGAVVLPWLLASACALLFACGQDSPATPPGADPQADGSVSFPTTNQGPYPTTAKVAVHEQFLDDLARERDPSDGQGSVRLITEEGQDGSVLAGGWGTWTFEYTAGPLGIEPDGALMLLVPPFWGWSTPQSATPKRPGYTTVSCSAPEVQLSAETLDTSLMRFQVSGRALQAGETIRIVYGDSEALARADDYAEANSAFYFKVDGNGDGLADLVADRPAITIHAREASRLAISLPSTAAPEREVELNVAMLDAMANHAPQGQGRLLLESRPPGLTFPESVELSADAGGHLRIPVRTSTSGIYRVHVQVEGAEPPINGTSNPMRVAEDIAPIFWGDLHGHSNYSDGTGTPQAYYDYARDVSNLDFAVLTDHDHFGLRFLDATPEIWQEIRSVVESTNDPERFVALLGYEWTSWLYGHRHVVYFDGQGEVLSSVGASTTTPAELWQALEGRDALTFAHHSAGGPVATDWSFVPDPVLEPVTEIMSIHGSSEADDSPARIRGGIPGNFVRDQLDRGTRFGFIGSGDSHDGHPGHAHLSPNSGYRKARPDPRGERADHRNGNGGLAAVFAASLNEKDLLAAFRKRSTYATSGPRIWLQATLAGQGMGSVIGAEQVGDVAKLWVEFAGTSGVEYVELIRPGQPIARFPCDGALEGAFEREVKGLQAGDYLYVRLFQNDGALAWSSPFFVEQ